MDSVEIIEFLEKYKNYFKVLNYEWIEKYFIVETTDEHVLKNPVESILNKGGFIYFAKFNNKIVGTFALIKVDKGTFEISKMAVNKKFQNRGIGKKMMDTAIKKAKSMSLDKLILYTNSQLLTAIKLYTKYGFIEIPKNEFHNNRADLKMELILNK